MTNCNPNKTHSSYKNLKKVFGVTLVELMIAVTIGSIVALGISSVYSSSKRSFKLQEEFSRMQENGRFAMNYIARFVRGAGYSGCSSALGNMHNDIDSTDVELMFQTGLEGYEAVGTAPSSTVSVLPEYPNATNTVSDFAILNSAATSVNISASAINELDPLKNSDILIARAAGDSGIEIVENNKSANFLINWVSTELSTGATPCVIVDPNDPNNTTNETGYNGLCPDQFLVISDCNKSVAFQVSNMQLLGGNPPTVRIVHNLSGTPGNKNASWGPANSNAKPGFDFITGDELVSITTKFFFVGKGVNGPALFMKANTAAPIEIVEGIENMQVLYGVDAGTDNIPDGYVPADKVTDFATVTAVRISVLLRSVNNLPWRPQKSEVHLLGGMTNATATKVTSPNDRRLRKVMSMTIKIRNRALTL